MTPGADEPQFKIWAADNMVYGPVPLSVVIQWAQDERVLPATWVHSVSDNEWRPAREVAELQGQFATLPIDLPVAAPAGDGRHTLTDPDELRQFSLFAGLNNRDLATFTRFCELRSAPAGTVLLHKGDPGDSIYFVLEGEVRARLVVGFDDTTLCRIPAGQFFGEMAMFTQSARAADVVVEAHSRLLRLSSEAFRLLLSQFPGVAGPILYAFAQELAHRLSLANVRLQRDTAAQFVWR